MYVKSLGFKPRCQIFKLLFSGFFFQYRYHDCTYLSFLRQKPGGYKKSEPLGVLPIDSVKFIKIHQKAPLLLFRKIIKVKERLCKHCRFHNKPLLKLLIKDSLPPFALIVNSIWKISHLFLIFFEGCKKYRDLTKSLTYDIIDKILFFWRYYIYYGP